MMYMCPLIWIEADLCGNRPRRTHTEQRISSFRRFTAPITHAPLSRQWARRKRELVASFLCLALALAHFPSALNIHKFCVFVSFRPKSHSVRQYLSYSFRTSQARGGFFSVFRRCRFSFPPTCRSNMPYTFRSCRMSVANTANRSQPQEIPTNTHTLAHTDTSTLCVRRDCMCGVLVCEPRHCVRHCAGIVPVQIVFIINIKSFERLFR